MNDTLFGKILRKEIPTDIIYEDDLSIAFNDINPQAPIHILIIPKEHIVILMECNLDHQNILSKMLLLAPKLAKESNLKGFRVMINSGKSGGQEVFHIHFHVFGGSKKLAKL